MYEILVPVDDERRAVAAAGAVADLPVTGDVEVSVLHVFTDNPSGAGVGQVAGVRRARERLAAAGHDPRLLGASGDPAMEIVDVAERRDVDLVVLAGRKRSAAGKLLFGSTTQEVLLDLDRPVLVAGPDDAPGPGDGADPDGDEADPDGDETNPGDDETDPEGDGADSDGDETGPGDDGAHPDDDAG